MIRNLKKNITVYDEETDKMVKKNYDKSVVINREGNTKPETDLPQNKSEPKEILKSKPLAEVKGIPDEDVIREVKEELEKIPEGGILLNPMNPFLRSPNNEEMLKGQKNENANVNEDLSDQGIVPIILQISECLNK